MKAATTRLIRRLEKSEWFCQVGCDIDVDVVRVSSWSKAVKVSKSKASNHAAIEGQNLLTERLCFEYPDRYHQVWNALVCEIKRIIMPLIQKKTSAVIRENKLPKDFRDAVNWDILAACMEQEYADLIPPKYFLERAEWYLAGHFPCGWEGVFPDGRLIVF